jgi:hypothetical protein
MMGVFGENTDADADAASSLGRDGDVFGTSFDGLHRMAGLSSSSSGGNNKEVQAETKPRLFSRE